ncbi:MAG TPA: type II secretion system protein, partial [Planctomycetota bacterium]|nr:type II secretion system protein [Planctomycetota bacterium]
TRPPGDAGFTLLEAMLAFALIAITMSFLTIANEQSFRSGVKALDLREIRSMADTVFRRIVYEHWKWSDGETITADQWYAEFAEIRGSQKDRWKVYRLVLRKKKGVVAGTDPSGRLDNLFEEEDFYDRDRYGEPRSRRTEPDTTPAPTEGTEGADGAAATGEPAYLVELSVYLEGNEEPELTLRSIVPVPDGEREDEAAR